MIQKGSGGNGVHLRCKELFPNLPITKVQHFSNGGIVQRLEQWNHKKQMQPN